jgi:hypothetical protein
MSHTLHRRGPDDTLAGDYVVFSMSAKGINEQGSGAKLARFLELAANYAPVNMGDMKTGNATRMPAAEIIGATQDTSIVHAVFEDPGRVAGFLTDLAAAGLGTSVIVSGLFGKVSRCVHTAGLAPHTIEHSLGFKGDLQRLPPEGVLRLTTMCGHGMVSAALVRRALRDIKRGRKTVAEAAAYLARPCECGVFNPLRAGRLLADLAAAYTLRQ